MQIIIERTVDLTRLVTIEALQGYVFTQEADAHVFRIGCTRDREPLALNGEVFAHFTRADNTTVYLGADHAWIEDGRAVVALHSDCYNVPGRFQLSVFYTAADGAYTMCIYTCTSAVQRARGGTMIDSGGAVSKVSYMNALFARNIGDIEGELDTFREEHETLTSALEQQNAATAATEDEVNENFRQVMNAIQAAGLDVRIINTPNLLTQRFWEIDDDKTIIYGSAARRYASSAPFVKSLSNPVETTYTEEPEDKGDSCYQDEDGVWHVFRDSDEIRTSLAELDEPITESDGEQYTHALQFAVTAASAWGSTEKIIFNHGSDGGSYEREVTNAETGEVTTETVRYPPSGLLEMEDGRTYTLSCWARVTSGEGARLRFAYGYDGYGNERIDPATYSDKDISGGEWQRVYWTFVYHAETSRTPGGGTGPIVSVNRKRVGVGVCRWKTATVQLCGFRLTAGGLYENNTIDTLTAEVGELRQAVADLQAMVLENT